MEVMIETASGSNNAFAPSQRGGLLCNAQLTLMTPLDACCLSFHRAEQLYSVLALQRRQGNVRFKTKAGGQQEREALLETKTHRRVNRRQVCAEQQLTVHAYHVPR